MPPSSVRLSDGEGPPQCACGRGHHFSEGGPIVGTATYSDYREVGGMRVPHNYVESNEMTGRAIYQVERVEVGVELPTDTFTLQPSTTPGG